MKNRLTIAAGLVALAALAVALGTAQASSRSAAKLSVRTTVYGKALFGPTGKALYAFGADHTSASHCYGACATAWPPLLTSAAPLAGTGVEAKLLGTTKRTNGTLQVTYAGHPLYYYSADPVGKPKCQHVNLNGGLWLVVEPNGHVNMAQAKTG